ncbi:hypothetical protein EAE99_005455 [Botrytis elliptica]|nr:hypothetical protein EAE99_005455 [Botrytis elliptica]
MRIYPTHHTPNQFYPTPEFSTQNPKSTTPAAPHNRRNSSPTLISTFNAHPQLHATYAQASTAKSTSGARHALADINGENAPKAAETARKYATHPDVRTLIIGVDVADAESVQKMIDVTAKELGRIDYAVNGAGVQSSSSLFFFDFDKVTSVNTKGLMLCVRAELNAMLAHETRKMTSRSGERDIGRGVILNANSATSYAGLPAETAYTVSKHAVMGLTKMAALDHAADGIRVNAACPTWVRTPMVEEECRRNPTVMQMVES